MTRGWFWVFIVVLVLTGGAVVADTGYRHLTAQAATQGLTGEACVAHCAPLIVRSLNTEKGCICVLGILLEPAVSTCSRFCGVRSARWLASTETGFLCTCEELPNMGVCAVPPVRPHAKR